MFLPRRSWGKTPVRAPNSLLPKPSADILARSAEKVYRIMPSEAKMTSIDTTPPGPPMPRRRGELPCIPHPGGPLALAFQPATKPGSRPTAAPGFFPGTLDDAICTAPLHHFPAAANLLQTRLTFCDRDHDRAWNFSIAPLIASGFFHSRSRSRPESGQISAGNYGPAGVSSFRSQAPIALYFLQSRSGSR
jgi:hypothetical protein